VHNVSVMCDDKCGARVNNDLLKLGLWPRLHSMCCVQHMVKVGQNHIYTYIYAVYLVISKPKIPYIHRIYMVLANLKYGTYML
jgi:hypothetical protein